MSTQITPVVPDLTADEMADSITGYEQVAIKASFGQTLSELGEDSFMALRALVFMHKRRTTPAEVKDRELYKQVMAMTVGQIKVGAYFAKPEPEAMPEEPITDQGKDSSQPDELPESWRPGASPLAGAHASSTS